MIERINGAGVRVVAVDVPSGVNASTGEVPGAAVRAEATVTFGAPKVGLVLLPGAEHAGAIEVVDIGFDDDAMQPSAWLTEPSDVAGVLPPRPLDGQKRTSGSVVVVAGSRAMTGAARLVSRAAMRVGAGYVVVALPASIMPVVQTDVTEAVFLPVAETSAGSISPDAVDAVIDAASKAHAVAIGPGLSRDAGTASFIREVVRTSPVPLVVDADALNAFADDAGAIADRKAEAVLTPHGGELARLLGREPAADRIADARALADASHAVSLVKGHRTVVVDQAGIAHVNTTGSTALATAGTGDVLTGTIGGLLARGVDPSAAAWAGAYIHGLAGLAAGERTGDGTVAGDVADLLPEAIARIAGNA
jgi:NAD(P)H-hydrate epimerase